MNTSTTKIQPLQSILLSLTGGERSPATATTIPQVGQGPLPTAAGAGALDTLRPPGGARRPQPTPARAEVQSQRPPP